MKELTGVIERVTKTAIKNKGFTDAQVIYDWQIIVGDFLAKHTTPLKITYPHNKNTDGTLHIEVISATAPIIQTLEPEIIEKIASYFGFKAIEKIRLIHSSRKVF